jgi:OOP family OmpA-OmpF porin
MKKGEKSMQALSKCTASILILGMSVALFAQNEPKSVVYTDTNNNTQTIKVETAQFATNRPEACAEKKPAPVEEPKPAAAPKPEADSDGDGVVDSLDKCPDTPHGYKVDPTGCPVSVTLHLHFAFNSSVIPVSDYPEVEKLARVMKENPPAKAIIVGHTDWTGSDEYNQKLSERRSQALKDKLIANGIAADRISASGKGEKEPVATNTTREGRAQNRRIEVQLQ